MHTEATENSQHIHSERPYTSGRHTLRADRTRAQGGAVTRRRTLSEHPKVLVVDDEESLTDLIGLALRYEQFEVDVAHTAKAAMAALPVFRPDLVVLDIMLPDIDGFEVARRIAAESPSTPVLFLTARDGTEDKVRGLTLGGDDYMTKPFSLEELVARIRAILRRTQRDGGAHDVSSTRTSRWTRTPTRCAAPARVSS